MVETDTNGSSAFEQIVTTQSYDGLNRVVTSYNPYDSWGYLIGQDPNQPGYGTDPATTFTYDGLGRVKTATTADNAITRTSYSGNQTTVLDPAQVTQTMTYDGLGRLTTLADAALTTSYAYDGNGNMKQATQGSQTRTFTYDSLNRLASSINPESGTVLYTYDNVGNLYQRTDNRGIVTTNTYDALNRLQQTTYTNPAGTQSTPTVTYTYDSGTNANGQLTGVATSGVSATSYTSFDVMGRFHASAQQTGGQTFTFGYAYNYAGALTGETYPSGRSLTIGYDAANRQNAVNGTMSGQNTAYINSAGYGPNGGLLSYFTNNNLLTLNQLYNMHQQVSYLAVARGNNYQGQNYFAQTMDWGTSNNNGVRLNGKKEYISNNAALPSTPTFSQTFSYDGVNRLLSASDTGGWSQTYGYDQYGNMWMPPTSNPLPSLSGAAPTTNIYNANNQNPNVSYDGAGNQTSLGSLTLSYDAENRQSQIANLGGGTGTFQYDGLGHRVVKSLPSQTTTYVYDAFGQLAAEYYSGTKPTPPCSTCFLTYDYLGNVRMVTDAQANIVARHDFAPFGQEIPSGTGGRGSQWGATTDVDMKFTGQIRDQEASEDFFNARYFAFALGRFNSPDPGNAGAMLGSSQSWNGYGYVSGNPLAMVDPSGTYLEQLGGCFFDRTDFYVDGNYDSSERTFIGCTSGASGRDSSGGGGGATPQRGISPTLQRLATAIRNSINNNQLNQCTGLAAYADAAQALFGTGNLSTAMSFLTPNSAPGQSLAGVYAAGAGLGSPGSDSGFLNQYQNSSPDNPSTGWNGDQTHHFAAFFQLGFSHPAASGVVPTPFLFEAAESLRDGGGINQGDVNLGVAAQQMGQGVARGNIPGNQLGDTIRSQVCSSGH